MSKLNIMELSILKDEIDHRENIVVYGTGIMGSLILHWLTSSLNRHDAYICVSDSQKKEEHFFGRSVYYYSELNEIVDKALVIIAAKKPTSCKILEGINCEAVDVAIIEDKAIIELYDFDQSFSMQCEAVLDAERKKNALHEYMVQVYQKQQEMFVKTLPQAALSFEVHLAEHCNLNCKNCDHFSPLADTEFVDIEKLRMDFQRIAYLTKGVIGTIQLLGGEPLLHPGKEEIISMTREIFPFARIIVVSNGILLGSAADSLWYTLAHNNVELSVTKYPIALDYDYMKQRASDAGVTFHFYGKQEDRKTLWHLPIDERGAQNPSWNFSVCHRINRCVILSDEKIYPCIIPANIKHFNKYFDKSIPVTERDYIDIYKADSIEEITEFLCKPLPFCRFCNINGETQGHLWEQTSKDLSEWT